MTGIEIVLLVVGMSVLLASFISGYISAKQFKKYRRNHSARKTHRAYGGFGKRKIHACV